MHPASLSPTNVRAVAVGAVDSSVWPAKRFEILNTSKSRGLSRYKEAAKWPKKGGFEKVASAGQSGLRARR